jgi:hypothetical protein
MSVPPSGSHPSRRKEIRCRIIAGSSEIKRAAKQWTESISKPSEKGGGSSGFVVL